MARPGLFRHRKFVRLARLLGSDALAAGHLEIIWHAAYEAGEANLGTAADLEYLSRWTGKQNVLLESLLEAKFIDDNGDGTFSIHDLMDHAPDYVQKRMIREDERRRKGVAISALRSEAGRKGGLARAAKQSASQCQANGKPVASVCQGATQANGGTPAPAPAPAHSTSIPSHTPPLSADADGAKHSEEITKPEYPSCFVLWWKQYPPRRRTGQRKAFTEYLAAGRRLVAGGMTRDQAAGYLQQRCIEFAQSPLGLSKYACNPAKWLAQGMYGDDPEAWSRAEDNGHAEEEEPRVYNN